MLCPRCGRTTGEDLASLCLECSMGGTKGLEIENSETCSPAPTEIEDQILFEPEVAGFYFRATAFLIDYCLSGIIIYLSIFLIQKFFPNLIFKFIFDNFDLGKANYGFSLGTLLGFPIVPLMESFLGGTPGKLVIGLLVVTLEGDRVSYGKAVIRHLIRSLTAFFWYIGFLSALFTKYKQAPHDYLTDTIVIIKWKLNWFVVLIVTVLMMILFLMLSFIFEKGSKDYFTSRTEKIQQTEVFEKDKIQAEIELQAIDSILYDINQKSKEELPEFLTKYKIQVNKKNDEGNIKDKK